MQVEWDRFGIEEGMSNERRVRVFVNARSGGGKAAADRLPPLFAKYGCGCEVTQLSHELDLEKLAKRDEIEVSYVAAGGDGTVNCVANAVARSRRKMGVLPLGTLNHFAKDLGLPGELEAAVAVAAGTATRAVDAAEINGRVFVNNSGLGAYPLMVLDRERMKQAGRNKWVALVVASAKAFARLWRVRAEIEVDGVTRVSKTPFVFVGNNEYCMEAGRLGRRERLDGGELAVYFAHGLGRLGVLKLAAAALLGRVNDVPEYEEMKGRQVVVRVPRRRPRVSLDGEVQRLAGPLVYRALPGALQVLCGMEPEGQAEVKL